jgi:DNA polymerase III epsilon subunit-like protein
MNEDWAREVLADSRTAVLDTETTGLYGYICEIAILGKDGELLNTLVNPQAPVEAGARRIHRITDEELSSAPVFADIWPKVQALLDDRRIIIWNADFDIGVINRELSRLGEPMIALSECAMRKYSDWFHGYEDAPFVRLNGGHRAAEDCRAVFERLEEMARDE